MERKYQQNNLCLFDKAIIVFLFLALGVSALSYISEDSSVARVGGPMFSFIAAAVVVIRYGVSSLLKISVFGVLLLPYLICRLSLQIYECGFDVPTISFALLIVVVMSFLIVGGTYGIKAGYLSFSAFAIVASVIALCYLRKIVAMASSERFTLDGGHPNLVGYLCLANACVGLSFLFHRSGWVRILGGGIYLLNVLLMFFSESRGNLAAVLVATFSVAGLWLWKSGRSGLGKLALRIMLLFLLLAILLLVAMAGKHEILDYLVDKLQIFSEGRGIDSGGSGRIVQWEYVLSKLDVVTFLLGMGYRLSDLTYDAIDNSYIVLLLELGFIVPTLVVVWMSVRVWQAASAQKAMPGQSLYCAEVFSFSVLIGCGVSCFFCRYLIAVGNPVSLVMLLILCSTSATQTLLRNAFNKGKNTIQEL